MGGSCSLFYWPIVCLLPLLSSIPYLHKIARVFMLLSNLRKLGLLATPDQCNSFMTMGGEFEHLLQVLNIKAVAATAKNPQSKVIYKQIHQTVKSLSNRLLLIRPH